MKGNRAEDSFSLSKEIVYSIKSAGLKIAKLEESLSWYIILALALVGYLGEACR